MSRGQIVTAIAFVCVTEYAVTPFLLVAVPLLFMAGRMSTSFLAMNQTTLQMNVEDEIRGRVLSIYLLTWGMLPLG